MIKQGLEKGSCLVNIPNKSCSPACQATLKFEDGQYHRVITSSHLSRPEDYFSIYQSGCNFTCQNCHSWEFSQFYNGNWMSTDEIANISKEYESMVTVWEPKKRALMITAMDLCLHCGHCIIYGKKGPNCPNKLNDDKILLGPQGFGPARNIIAFTGGDILCQPNFYTEVTEKIKEKCKKMWVLLETNGFGLTEKNLDTLQQAEVDSFWLDIKAFDENLHKKLCGVSNKTVLKAPQRIYDRHMQLEVLTPYIPGWVEADQIEKIAELIADVNSDIYYIILAFFPEYKLVKERSPTLYEMLKAYSIAKSKGLKNVKLGNTGIFVKTKQDMETLLAIAGKEAIG